MILVLHYASAILRMHKKLCSIISIKLLCNCIKLQYITANVQSLIAAEYIKVMPNQGHHNICNKFV